MQLFILPFFTFQLFWRHTQSLAPISSPKMMTTSSCLADYLVVSCEGGGRSVIDGGGGSGGGGTGGRGAAGRAEENEAVEKISPTSNLAKLKWREAKGPRSTVSSHCQQ